MIYTCRPTAYCCSTHREKNKEIILIKYKSLLSGENKKKHFKISSLKCLPSMLSYKEEKIIPRKQSCAFHRRNGTLSNPLRLSRNNFLFVHRSRY